MQTQTADGGAVEWLAIASEGISIPIPGFFSVKIVRVKHASEFRNPMGSPAGPGDSG